MLLSYEFWYFISGYLFIFNVKIALALTVDLKKLDHKWQKFNLQIFTEQLPRLTEDKLVSDLEVLANVKLRLGINNDVHLEAELKSHYTRSCDICLKPVRRYFEGGFKLQLFSEEDAKLWNQKKEIHTDETDADIYGDNFFLEKYLEDYLILELKDYFKCSEDCSI